MAKQDHQLHVTNNRGTHNDVAGVLYPQISNQFYNTINTIQVCQTGKAQLVQIYTE